MDILIDEGDSEKTYVETVRETKVYSLRDVQEGAVDENQTFIELPKLFKTINENSQLCGTEEVPASKIVKDIDLVNEKIEEYKKICYDFRCQCENIQVSILNILKHYQDHNARSKPQYAMTIDKVTLGMSQSKVKMNVTTEICIPKRNRETEIMYIEEVISA